MKLLVGDGRQWVCSQAVRDVLELAFGTGRNLPSYPADVRLTEVDLTPARQRANALGRQVDMRVADAQVLDLPDARFDTVVATLARSSIPDDRQAIGEARRVLRPGGRLLLLEHVRSPLLPVRVLQRLLNPFFARCYGDHLRREPLDHLVTVGLVIERVERSEWGTIERIAARKPLVHHTLA